MDVIGYENRSTILKEINIDFTIHLRNLILKCKIIY